MFCPQVQRFTINTLKYIKFSEILVYYFVSPEAIRIKDHLNVCLHQTIHYCAWYVSACLLSSKYKDDFVKRKKKALKGYIRTKYGDAQITPPHLPLNT